MNVGREEGQIKGRHEQIDGQTGRMREREFKREMDGEKRGNGKHREKEPLGERIIRPLPPSGAAANGRG